MYGALGPISEVVLSETTSRTLGVITAGKRWRILGGVIVAGAAGATFRFESSSGDDARALTGFIVLPAGGSPAMVPNEFGFGTTDTGNKLHLNLTAGAINGMLQLQLID